MKSFFLAVGGHGTFIKPGLVRRSSRCRRTNKLFVVCAASICAIVSLGGISCGQDDSVARKMAAAIAKKAAVSFFDQWQFEVDDAGVKGEVKAVKPEEHVKVELTEFHLSGDSVMLGLSIDARYEFKGKLKAGDKTITVKANADVAHAISLRADFHEEGNKLIIRPRAHRLKLEVKKLEVEPSDIADAERIVKSLIKKNRDQFLKDLNDWLTKNTIKAE